MNTKERKKIADQERFILKQDNNLPHAIIVDIDGTLSLVNTKTPEDIKEDKLNYPVLSIVNNYKKLGVKIIILTGRNADKDNSTKKWLKDKGIKYDELIQRTIVDSYLSDKQFKKMVYKEKLKSKYYIDFILEDRNKIVKMWRKLGLLCLQVYYGDF